MIFRTAIVLAVAVVTAVDAQYDDPTFNIQVGMQGLMEAGKDPAVLAQLMKDLQVN